MKKYFSVTIESEISSEEVWPDGDAPENPTAEDVAKVMRGCGNETTVVNDWFLIDRNVEVDGVRVWT